MKQLLAKYVCLVVFSFASLGQMTEAKKEKYIGKIVDIPTLGRPVMLGELYSAHSDQFIPGFSLWPPDEIKHEKRVIWNPSSHTEFSADSSRDNKLTTLKVDASLAGSFEAGMIHISGSAHYLDNKEDDENTASVTLSYKSITRTETLSSTLTKKTDKTNCKLPLDKNSQATHVVASVTFGGNCHFVFSTTLRKNDDKKDIHGTLSILIKAETFTIKGSASLTIGTKIDDLKKHLTVKLYSDFILEKQPLNFNDTLKIYQDISSNFGSKDSLYNQSVPMSMVLIPLELFCKNSGLAAEIAKDILKRATDVRLTLLKVLDEIAKLLDSRAAVGNFKVTQLLQDFHSDVANYTLHYEANLQQIIIGARNPNISKINETALVSLIDSYTDHDYDYATYLYPYLTQKTRQVNAINIFYDQTVLQDEPQIAVYSKADIPQAIITEHIVFVLTLYVLPNVTAEKYSAYINQKSPKVRETWLKDAWYNKFTTVGEVGTTWRNFRSFFEMNEYEDGTHYFVLLEPEKTDKTIMDLKLWVDGVNTVFQLAKLMKLTVKPSVCRSASKITITVGNPPAKLPSTISNLLVNFTKTTSDEQNKYDTNSPTWFEVPFSKSSTSTVITIPNLVPEYSYNVTVAYSTEYGSLTPSKVITTVGQFDQMMKTVGCQIVTNTKKKSIGLNALNTSAFDCATACLFNSSCSHGWTFQLGTGNCYFNTGESNSTDSKGWAVGTQACGAVQPVDEQEYCANVLFLMPSKIVQLPSFKPLDCSIPPYPGAQKRTVSGLVDGFIMTCGGGNGAGLVPSATSSSCYSLEYGVWVKKNSMAVERTGSSASQYPTGGLMVTYPTTEIFSSGNWTPGITLPEVENLRLACQVTLGTTIILTGGYPGRTDVYSLPQGANHWTPLPNMTTSRFDHACAVKGDTVYVIGGEIAWTSVEKFKLGWDSWEKVTDLPIDNIYNGQAVVFENTLYFISGYTPTDWVGMVFMLDDDEKKWTNVTDVGKFSPQGQFNPAQVLTRNSIGC